MKVEKSIRRQSQLQQEISERKRIEEALREERDRIRKYLDVARVILLAISADQRVILINKKGCEVLGCKENEVIGKNWFETFIPEPEGKKMGNIFARLMSGDGELTEYVENAVCRKDGEERIIAWHNTLLLNDEGRPMGTLSSGDDVTEQSLIAAELGQYRTHLETLVQERTKELTEAIQRLQSETFERKKAIEEAVIMEERSRLARELHDSVTQSLYSLVLFAQTSRELAAMGDMDRLESCLVDLIKTARGVFKEMRLLVYDLRPAALGEEGLVGAIQQRLEAVERRSGVKSQMIIEKMGDLPAAVEEGLYRIAQEALNNALKHAAATEVVVRFKVDDEHVEMEVWDNGVGFVPELVYGKGGLGLISMRERAEKLMGSAKIESALGQGTRIKVMVKRYPIKSTLNADRFMISVKHNLST